MNSKLTWELHAEDSRLLLLKIDGEDWKEVYKPLFQRHLSDLSRAVSREALEERFSLLEEKLCKIEAFRLLSVKGRLSKELEAKLALKCFSKKAIVYALEECIRLRVLDDQEESKTLALRLQRKGYGAALIAAKMREKGASFSAEELEDPAQMIRQLLEGKLRNRPKEKAIAALCRRGFAYTTILDVINSKDCL